MGINTDFRTLNSKRNILIGILGQPFDIMPFTQGLTIRLAESLKKQDND